MTIKLGLLSLGALLIYAGWKNLSVQALIFGDNTVQKTGSGFPQTPSQSAGTSAPTASNTSSGIASGGAAIIVGPHGRTPIG